MLCGDIRTEMVKHKIYLLTLALSHIGHIHNIGKDRSVFRVNAKWIYIVQVPLHNALVLSNLCEYRH